ncbi:MAG: hypothetical protein WDW38_006006 [Sanguina aurantia]
MPPTQHARCRVVAHPDPAGAPLQSGNVGSFTAAEKGRAGNRTARIFRFATGRTASGNEDYSGLFEAIAPVS